MKTRYDLKKLEKSAKKTIVDKGAAKIPISIRLDGSVLAKLREEALRMGIPYQTFIGSILFQYASGDLVKRRSS